MPTRTARVSVRVTTSDREALDRAAAAERLDLASWARRALLNAADAQERERRDRDRDRVEKARRKKGPGA